MNRRNLIKSSILATTLAPLCNSKSIAKEATINDDKPLTITPKQLSTYKFSVPLLFHHPFIDKMAELNQQYKKSQVKILYNSIPWPLASTFNEYFTLCRGGYNNTIKNYKDFASYVHHAIDNGFEVRYLLNSPKPMNEEDFNKVKDDFYRLIDDIYASGIKQVKVSTPQVANLVYTHNPNMKFATSTIFELFTLQQYDNLINNFPNIEVIDIEKDHNQNFLFLKNLKSMHPNVDLEIMMNEGCMKGCCSRYSCMCSSVTSRWKIGCKQSRDQHNTFNTGMIYPWNLPYYSAINVNHFKFVPEHQRAEDKDMPSVNQFLHIAEYGIYDCDKEKLVNELRLPEEYSKLPRETIIDNVLKPLTADMDYFVKYGHLCSTRCHSECTYCYDKQKKLTEFMESVEKDLG